jgi:ribosomal protein S18 acetylase RimI-like enzyme
LIVLRPAVRSDATAIHAVFRAARDQALWYLPRLHTDADTQAWIEHVMLRDCVVTVAVRDGRVVGFGACAGGFLHHLYVAAEAQGIGAGSALLETAKAANPGGLKLYAFQRNSKARAFYEKRGFAVIRLSDGQANEEKEPDALYEWRG